MRSLPEHTQNHHSRSRRGRDFSLQRWLVAGIVMMIHAYQYLLSPLFGPACRFWPSCSCYVKEAFIHHGLWRGLILSLRRLLRCHPWGGHGIDMVPEKRQSQPQKSVTPQTKRVHRL